MFKKTLKVLQIAFLMVLLFTILLFFLRNDNFRAVVFFLAFFLFMYLIFVLIWISIKARKTLDHYDGKTFFSFSLPLEGFHKKTSKYVTITFLSLFVIFIGTFMFQWAVTKGTPEVCGTDYCIVNHGEIINPSITYDQYLLYTNITTVTFLAILEIMTLFTIIIIHKYQFQRLGSSTDRAEASGA